MLLIYAHILTTKKGIKTMKNENKQSLGRTFYDILDDKTIEKAEKEARVENLKKILNIAKECSSLDEFINTIQGMIDSEQS